MFYICNFGNIKMPFFSGNFFLFTFFFSLSLLRPQSTSLGDLNNLCVHFFRHVEKEETTSSL